MSGRLPLLAGSQFGIAEELLALLHGLVDLLLVTELLLGHVGRPVQALLDLLAVFLAGVLQAVLELAKSHGAPFRAAGKALSVWGGCLQKLSPPRRQRAPAGASG
ncbi:hypothetical protein [Saccharopolyspora pogona]|uniref:hypothetical protein n=1 Tax=Saccharopolyspora pogona TaxID=333966 RepID=UPI001682DC3A|nr:hypothetical protein [Saccharopolyspora pogona]